MSEVEWEAVTLYKSFCNTVNLALTIRFSYFQKIMIEEKDHSKTSVQYDNVSVPSYEEHPNELPEPTEQDWKELREVSDAIPKAAFLIILLEICERFTYYGLSGPFQNYIQYPAPPSCMYKLKVDV